MAVWMFFKSPEIVPHLVDAVKLNHRVHQFVGQLVVVCQIEVQGGVFVADGEQLQIEFETVDILEKLSILFVIIGIIYTFHKNLSVINLVGQGSI